MYLALLLFVIGVLSPSQMPVLPTLSSLVWILFAMSLALLRPATRPIIGLLVGFAYLIYSGQSWLDHRIPIEIEGTPVTLVGTVMQMPVKSQNGWRIRLFVEQGELSGRRLALGWYESEPPNAGETWQLRVKLSRPRGLVNPGLFDYAAYLLSQDIHATGYVLPGAKKSRLSESRLEGLFERARYQLVERVTSRVEASPATSMLLALLVGDSSQLSGESWDTLSATGTNHLLIVSGLHVSLVIGLVFMFLNRCLGGSRALSVSIAILVACGYSLITGFGLPVQRALIMSSIGLLVLTARRQTAVWHALTLALASVLLINPFASLAAGFWLSFGAVAGLLYAFQGRRISRFAMIPMLVRSQWVALLITAPLLLCWVYKFSLASLLANLIAIPLVSLLVVPALLLVLLTELFCWHLASFWLIDIVLFCLSRLFSFLQFLADLDWMIHQPIELGWSMMLAIVGSLLLLLPRISVPRWMGILCWLPMLNPVSTDIDGTKVDVFDVGQGLSVLIQTGHHSLIYDAGPALGRFDAGQQIIAPMLDKMGVSGLDLMVISHGDNDHAGGATAIQRALVINESVHGPCLERRVWEFADLRAELLIAEGIGESDKGNERSCVLLVETSEATILLPGDIESQAEQGLLARGLSTVDLLIAPHHGSISSSNPAFINALSPDWVLFSAGHMNRFGHPHEEVVARYLNRGVRVLNTADSGLVSFHFQPGGRVEVTETRQTHRRFWYDERSRIGAK